MPKHDNPTPEYLDTIEAVRGPIRRLAERFPGKEPIDLALGAVYAAHDLALIAGMSPIEAVEWLRTAADLMERQVMAGAESRDR